MKRVLIVLIAIISPYILFAGDNKKKKPAATTKAVVNGNEIHWMNWDELQVAMKKEPRKVWVDVYTDWCGWCKRMDATTYKNPGVVKYLNTKFYAVKFNAEKDDNIMFIGKMYKIEGQTKTNQLAVELMNSQLSYPTSIFMDEHYQTRQAIPGFHPVGEMEIILTYLGEDLYKTKKFEEYQQSYKPTWDNGAPQQQMPPMAH